MKSLAVIAAVVAALLVFGAGAGVATTLITSAMIKDHTIKNADIADDAVNGRVVKNGALAASDLSGSAKDALGQMWAVVNADGTLARGRGAAWSDSLGVDGQYEVVFNRDVSHCAYVATIDYSAGGYEGEVSLAPREGNAKAVFVQTYVFNPGMDADLPFHLVVFC
jgi:hypothetical protein